MSEQEPINQNQWDIHAISQGLRSPAEKLPGGGYGFTLAGGTINMELYPNGLRQGVIRWDGGLQIDLFNTGIPTVNGENVTFKGNDPRKPWQLSINSNGEINPPIKGVQQRS